LHHIKAALRRDPQWLWLPALILMPLLAPVGEPHHLMFLLWPIAVGVRSLVEHFDPDSKNKKSA